MIIVSLINYIGGVGKTSITANLGAELAWRNYNVLLIDLDPQTSLTFSFINPDEWEKRFLKSNTIKDWFDSFESGEVKLLKDLIFVPERVNARLKDKGKLHLIPSHLGLINVDLELATQMGGSNLKQTKKNYIKIHRRLANGINKFNQDDFDVILIDCPPNFNIVTKNAIVASDFILIPAKPDYLSTLGIDYLKRNVNELVRDFNEYVDVDDGSEINKIDPKVLGVIFNMIQIYANVPISTIRPFIKQTKKLGIPVFDSFVRENKSLFGDSPQYGIPVILNAYNNNQTFKGIVKEMEEFVTEFIKKSNIKNGNTRN